MLDELSRKTDSENPSTEAAQSTDKAKPAGGSTEAEELKSKNSLEPGAVETEDLTPESMQRALSAAVPGQTIIPVKVVAGEPGAGLASDSPATAAAGPATATKTQAGAASDIHEDDRSNIEERNGKTLALQKRLEALSLFSLDFAALVIASTVIATLGLFENSAAVIIGAMIIAPLMRPLVGLSLATISADVLLLKRATFTLIVGSITGLLIAYAIAFVLQQIELTNEILARTKPNLLDLGVAVFAGAIGAYCQSNKKLSESLAGVAISVALVPPLSVVGIGLAYRQPDIWWGAMLLYLTNLVGITIAGALVFLAMGYAPLKRAKRGLVISSGLMLMLGVPLAFGMNSMLFENRLSKEIRDLLTSKTYTFRDVKLKDVEVRRYRKPVLVEATIYADQQIVPNQVRLVQAFLSKELQMPIEFKLKVIALTEVTSAEPLHQSNQNNAGPVNERHGGVQIPEGTIEGSAQESSEQAVQKKEQEITAGDDPQNKPRGDGEVSATKTSGSGVKLDNPEQIDKSIETGQSP